MEGKLTMQGVTKPVKLAVEFGGSAKDPRSGERTAFSATTTINRKDYGIKWNKDMDSGGMLVSDEVRKVPVKK